MIRFTYMVVGTFGDNPPEYEFFNEFKPAWRRALKLAEEIGADSSDDVDFIRFNTESPGLSPCRFKSVNATWEEM